MDTSIRQLLAASNAVSNEQDASNLLQQAHRLLEAASREAGRSDDLNVCGADLYVLAAETAFKLNQNKIAEGCLQMYFQGNQLTDQFLCRAYLCKAQLLASKAPNSSTDLDSAVVFLLKAINFAKDKSRYHFIVYNASVLFWQMARQFLRPGLRGLLHQSLQQIVKALDDIDDSDYEWRATLMIGLVESLVDVGKTKEATTVSETAADFILNNAKYKFKDIFKLQVKHKLIEYNKLATRVKAIPEFLAFLKLQKLKISVVQTQSDSKLNLKKELQALISGLNQKPGKSSSSSERKKSDQIEVVDPNKSRVSSVSPVRRRSRALSKVGPIEIQIELSLEMGKDLLPNLLIEIARFCVDVREMELARESLKILQLIDDKEPTIDMEIEFLECSMLVRDLGDNEEVYTSSAVDVRLFAIRRMDQALQNSIRSGKANIVQAACVTQWNLCLPLLQNNLRKHVRRPLTLVAQALEDISSLEIQLRCQVHTELAKCEENVEQVEAALRHIKKALQLDQSGLYHQRLHTMLRRLELSTQLYQTTETPEDTAAVIIEQAQKSADSGSVRMKRSLLVKAGLALAPDAFQYVLDSEGEVKIAGQKSVSEVQMLAAKARQWQKCVKKAAGHLKRLGDENDRERARLWADLAKVARKQEVWDVCRVAARFSLLYDDNRWSINRDNAVAQTNQPNLTVNNEIPKSQEASTDPDTAVQSQVAGVNMSDFSENNSLHDRDLLRMFAEVQFINGEALIHLLQCQGLKLNQSPRLPSSSHQRIKSSSSAVPSTEGSDWTSYTKWIQLLGNSVTKSFLRAIEIGVDLNESWIGCSATAYLWNYNKHLISESQYSQLVEVFETALNGLRTTGHSSETVLLVRVCNLIAQGLLKPWLRPKPPPDAAGDPTPDPADSKPPSRKKTPGKDKQSASASGGASVVVDNEAGDHLKKALEICEYAMNVTNGTVAKDIVPTAVRHELIATWVLLKQMLQQQIDSNLCTQNEVVPTQKDMTKALVALEIHTINGNGMMKLSVPPLSETVTMVEDCQWNDSSVLLEVWTRLAYLAHSSHEHSLVVKCASSALSLKKTVTAKNKTLKNASNKETADFEMLCFAACILGESIMTTVTSNPYARRKAMGSFLTSAQYANTAGNHELVMAACKHWWNVCLPLMSSSIERELLRQPLSKLLHYITSTSTKLKLAIEQKKQVEASSKAMLLTTETEKAPGEEDGDNILRAAMYGILFQTYTDKERWEEALTCMDQAIQHMPRTKHRLPIFKNRIMVKAKLGRSVFGDIAKFREESEEYVAHMWHRVALSSHESLQQLSSYQKAIESLHEEENLWVKFEYLAELSTWLYCNEYTINDAVNVLEWAADILFSMKFEVLVKEEVNPSSKGKKHKTPAKPSKTPASRGSEKTRESKRSVKIDAGADPSPKTADSSKGKDVKEEKKETEEDILPVEKEVIIGLDPSNLELKLNDLNSVRQLEGLVRTHVMLAIISGKGSESHKSYCLLAVGFIMRMWKIALQAAGLLISQLPKSEPTAEKPGGKGVNHPAPVKDKSQKRGPPEAFPENFADWSVYSPPDDIRRAFVFNEGDTALSTKTLTKPALTIYYLEELINELCFIGYHHLSFPVICLAEYIVSQIMGSESWSISMRIHRIKLCLDVNLIDSVKHWENIVGDNFLPEEEQSSFIQEHDLMLQHQKHVQSEEARIKKESGPEQEKKTDGTSESIIEPITLQGIKLKGVNMQQIWLQKAIRLLDLGYQQQARALLNQAMKSAVGIVDERLQGKIHLSMSQLALQNSNLGQAMKFLKLAQNIGGDEDYWYKVVLMLVDAILFNTDVTPEQEKEAINIMKSAIETMDILKEIRPTKFSKISYITCMISSRLSLYKLNNMLIRKKKLGSQMQVHLSKLENDESVLSSLGFHREAAVLCCKHADIILRLLERIEPWEAKQAHLLAGLEHMQHVVAELSKSYAEICSSINNKENSELTLPLQRELCDSQLMLARYSLCLYDLDSQQKISARLLQAKSGSLEHIVKEYVGDDNNNSPLQKEWDSVCSLIPQKIQSILISCHNITRTTPKRRANCLFLIGKALRLFSIYTEENIESAWNILAYEITTKKSEDELEIFDSQDTMQDDDENVAKQSDRISSTKSKFSDDSTLTTKQKNKLIEHGNKLFHQHSISQKLLCQAFEVLLQCVKYSLEHRFLNNVRDASLEIIEATAQLDSDTSSQFLALYQSTNASLAMEDLLMKMQPDPSVSQFAALLHKRSWLTKCSAQMRKSTLYQWTQRSLEKFTAWKRLSISPNHLNLMKEFPPNFNFVVIQHSPDYRYLYASIFDKPSSVSSSDGKNKPKDKQVNVQDSRTITIRSPVDHVALENLKERMEEYRLRLMSLLLQSEYQRAQLALRQKMLQQLSLGADNANMTISNTVLDEQEEEEMKLMDEFQEIIAELENYLSPVTAILRERLIDPLAKECEELIQSGQEADKNAMETIVLLLDEDLMTFPIEALHCFQNPFIDCLCRDFSLQMSYNRWHTDPEEAVLLTEKKKNEVKPTPKTPKAGKTPGGGASKIVPLNREVLPGCATINTNNVHYVVDPLDETAETEEFKPMQTFNQILQTYSVSCTPMWTGFTGSAGVPSIGQWETTLNGCEAFIFYGMERFFAPLSPAKISALNLQECQLALLLDKSQTSKSFRHQSKVDVDKNDSQLVLEKPLPTAMLLSLIGVNSICINLWHSTLEDNSSKLRSIAKTLLDDGQVIGKAVKSMMNPMLVKPKPPEPPPPSAPTGKAAADSKVGKGTKSKSESRRENIPDQPADPSPLSELESPRTEVTQPSPTPDISVGAAACNMVLFGLPNVMVV